MQKTSKMFYDLFLIFLLLKGTGLGLGAEMTWFEVFLPLLAYIGMAVFKLLAAIMGWDDSWKVWATKQVNNVIVWRNAKKLYRNTMRQTNNAANKGQK